MLLRVLLGRCPLEVAREVVHQVAVAVVNDRLPAPTARSELVGKGECDKAMEQKIDAINVYTSVRIPTSSSTSVVSMAVAVLEALHVRDTAGSTQSRDGAPHFSDSIDV
jgi:hypothetical protein